ncbi:unnamed protein product [Nyctereutes procyonoides]|uniref:Cyclin-dependent kinases regulatory subunit n=1 Tax=Nyctereutes procyonoides TaxID=34880 RepID=A0A811ZWM6_NYCPR|nr:unnamed protein product [Nyctereutes procyonoides]
MAHKQIYYSDKYFDEHYKYWHVIGVEETYVQQSLGCVHYMIHEPEPHFLLFR